MGAMPYYVYLYRDDHGRPQYVGYGKRPNRATVHWSKSHNRKLAVFVKKKAFSLEIAGPFVSEPVARVIETTLISALDPGFNGCKGPHTDRFRPIGVPKEYAKRPIEKPIRCIDFLDAQGKKPSPVLFVHINDEKFDDGRIGYDLAKPPSDIKLLERVKESWQLSGHLGCWREKPSNGPGLLIGIYGSPGSQLVIASIKIDQLKWTETVIEKYGLCTVPVENSIKPNLDAFGLRGRRVDPKAGIAFNSIRAGAFMVLKRNCTLTGGGKHQ
jgi:hypothetical protein